MGGVAGQAVPAICLMGQSNLDRAAYRRLLEGELAVRVVAECDFKPTSVWLALRTRSALVVANADLPAADVVDALQMVARLNGDVRVLVISAAIEAAQIDAWGRCAMHGYVVKDGGVAELRAGIETLLAGGRYFSPGIRPALQRAAGQGNGAVRLSRREAELLPLLARGMTLRDAAARMTVSYKTADSYRSSLLRKLGLHDRVGLARYAIRERIIEA